MFPHRSLTCSTRLTHLVVPALACPHVGVSTFQSTSLAFLSFAFPRNVTASRPLCSLFFAAACRPFWYSLPTFPGTLTPSLFHWCGTAVRYFLFPGLTSNNPPSSASAKLTELPVFLQRVNYRLAVSLAPSPFPQNADLPSFYVTHGLLHFSGFPFPVSGSPKCLWNTWSYRYPIAP